MNQSDELTDAIRAAAVEQNGQKKLACAEAFKLAKKFDVNIMDVGRICNR